MCTFETKMVYLKLPKINVIKKTGWNNMRFIGHHSWEKSSVLKVNCDHLIVTHLAGLGSWSCARQFPVGPEISDGSIMSVEMHGLV